MNNKEIWQEIYDKKYSRRATKCAKKVLQGGDPHHYFAIYGLAKKAEPLLRILDEFPDNAVMMSYYTSDSYPQNYYKKRKNVEGVLSILVAMGMIKRELDDIDKKWYYYIEEEE